MLFTSSAALYGAALLDQEGAPKLTQEQFEEPNQDPAGGPAHSPRDLLGKILRVEIRLRSR